MGSRADDGALTDPEQAFDEAIRLLDRGEAAKAEALLELVIGAARACGERTLLARASCVLGEWLEGQGRTAAARARLQEVLEVEVEEADLIAYEQARAREILGRQAPSTGARDGVARADEATPHPPPQVRTRPRGTGDIVSRPQQRTRTHGLRIRPFLEQDTERVVELWSRCGLLRPWNDPRQDIARKLLVQRELFMVGEAGGRLVAAMMVGYEGHRGWVNYLAVEPELQHRGVGREMMQEAERRLVALGCPKIQLQVRTDNVDAMAFYRRLGYVQDAVVSMGKRLIEDGGA
jgi:ribosomal protein S18 acetylase RimI-like enzyme